MQPRAVLWKRHWKMNAMNNWSASDGSAPAAYGLGEATRCPFEPQRAVVTVPAVAVPAVAVPAVAVPVPAVVVAAVAEASGRAVASRRQWRWRQRWR